MPDLNQHDITARMAVNEPLSAIDTTALREAAQQGKDIRQIALTARCECGERHPAQCPGAWEPGCDLGNNEKHVRAATEPDPGALRAATAPTVEPEEGAPGEAGLRWEIGHALSNTLGNPGEDGAVSIDPFDSDNIDPLVDAVIGVLRERGISVEQAEPLTDEQVRRGWSAISLHPHVDQRFVEGVRFAEHALGITADGGARVVAPPAPAAAEQAELPRGLRPGEPPPPPGVQVPQCDVCVGCREWGGNGLWHHAGCTRIPAEHPVAWLEPAPPAPAADAMPTGWREVIADVAADISDHPSLAHEKLRRLLASSPAPAAAEQAEPVAGFRLLPSRLTNEMRAAMADAARAYMARTGGNSPDAMYDAAVAAAPPAPVAAPAGEPAACISRTQGRIYAQLLPAGRSLPLGTSLYPQQSAAMFQPAPARQEPVSRTIDLWFFRELSDEQRMSLFRMAGLPADDIRSDATQRQCLRHILGAAPARQEPLTDEQIDTTAAEWESSRHSFTHGDGTADVKVEFTARRLRHFARAVRSLPAAPITAAPAEGEKR